MDIKNMTVAEIKCSIFDHSEQAKYCQNVIAELYKELPNKINSEKLASMGAEQSVALSPKPFKKK